MSGIRRLSGSARTALICTGVVVLMTGAAFGAVPLYEAFCKATGFAGIPRMADAKAAGAVKVTDTKVTVFFDTDVARGAPIVFEPLQRRQTVRIGATNMAFFKVTNTSDQPIVARAAYNVAPNLAAAHVRKLQCFCFDAQTLPPGKTIEFPMIYYLDPGMLADADTKGYRDLTFSYTFISNGPPKATQAAAPTASKG